MAAIAAMLIPAFPAHRAGPAACPPSFGPPRLPFFYVLNGISVQPTCGGWAVGVYDKVATRRRGALIERWDGKTWTPQLIPGPIDLQAVGATSANNAWAVGNSGVGNNAEPVILHWNGATWQTQPSPPPVGPRGFANLTAISAFSQAEAWAVGTSTRSGTLAERWNGSTWRLYPVPSPHHFGAYLDGVVTLAPDDAWASGNAFSARGRERALIEHWDGTAWRPVALPRPLPHHQDSLEAIAGTSPANIWAVGSFEDRGTLRGMAMHWNGITWRVLRMHSPPRQNVILNGLTVTPGSHAWATGYLSRNARDTGLIEHWNGTSWRPAHLPIRAEFMDAIASTPQTGAWALGQGFGRFENFALHCCPWRIAPPGR